MRTLRDPPKSEQKVRVEENGKAVRSWSGLTVKGLRNLARELYYR